MRYFLRDDLKNEKFSEKVETNQPRTFVFSHTKKYTLQ